MIPLPRLTLDGLADYFGIAIGLIVGFTIFEPPMEAVENGLRRR